MMSYIVNCHKYLFSVDRGEGVMSNTGVKITVICENSVAGPFGIVGEHGWSALVETGDRVILFDTGQGQGIVSNMLLLGKDFRDVDFIVLSHGHYDHTGGLPKALSITGRVPVYCHRDIFLERWWVRGESRREIGIRYKRSWLESIGADFRFVSEFTEIAPGIFLTGEVPRKTAFEPPDQNMKVVNESGELIQDDIRDDLSMVIDSEKGLIVVLGCAHAGLINILEYVHEMLPDRPFHAVVGGTHLGFAAMQQFEATLKALDDFDVRILGASHCTGLANSARLYNRLGERFYFASAGSVLEV